MLLHELDILKEALPYIKRFKGQIFVIKLSGKIAAQRELLLSLSKEVALLHQVGFFPVMVHGGGIQLSELAEKLGVKQKIINGRRITDQKTLDLAKMVLAGKINTDVTSALKSVGSKTVGLSGLDGQIILAKKRGIKKVIDSQSQQEMEVDYGFVGDVIQVDTKLIKLLLDEGYIPVISSLGADDDGNVFNINADTVASEIALGLKANKLIYLSDVNGILTDINDPSSKIDAIDIPFAYKLIESGKIKTGMIPKISSIIKLLKNGVKSAHIIGSEVKNPLLQEIFTNTGAGTMITSGLLGETDQGDNEYLTNRLGTPIIPSPSKTMRRSKNPTSGI